MEQVLKMNIDDVQKYLKENAINGWLIYDFLGLNRVAQELIRFTGKLITRRWFYYIPQAGDPTLLLHRIESMSFPNVPGQRLYYTGWKDLVAGLKQMLTGQKRIAMEYSPGAAVPTTSFVDAGTFEMVKQFVREIVSSANLIQYFTCRLSEAQLKSHQLAAEVLHQAQQEAFRYIEEQLRSGKSVTEYDVQQLIMKKIHDHGMISHSDAIVAVNENASNPHYAPSAAQFREIKKGDCILIDLWAKENRPEAVYADMTWMGYAGDDPPEEFVKVWNIVKQARDLAVDFLRNNHKAGKITRGYEVDAVVRDFIERQGYGDYFFHRTGHSIDQEDHGRGVNIDSYETQDFRDIVPGLLFSIEPGIYLPQFGVRSEIDVYYGDNGPEIYTSVQDDLVLMQV